MSSAFHSLPLVKINLPVQTQLHVLLFFRPNICNWFSPKYVFSPQILSHLHFLKSSTHCSTFKPAPTKIPDKSGGSDMNTHMASQRIQQLRKRTRHDTQMQPDHKSPFRKFLFFFFLNSLNHMIHST